MNFSDQSDPTLNRQFCKFWGQRDHFFCRFTPADLDREADRCLADGDARTAEILAWRAAAMREVAR